MTSVTKAELERLKEEAWHVPEQAPQCNALRATAPQFTVQAFAVCVKLGGLADGDGT